MKTDKENPEDLNIISSEKQKSQMDYISDSKETVYRHVPKKAANALYLLLGVILISFIWAYFAKLNVATNANGKIIATGELQQIQHLEGGIVKKILVKEGEHVKHGQELLILDNTRFASEYKEGQTKLAVLKADIVRLTAKVDGKDKLEFDSDFEKTYPVQVEEARKFFLRDKEAFDNNVALLDKQYQLLKKELNIMTPLSKQGVVSSVEILRLQRQAVSLQQAIQDKKNTEIDQAREQLNKAQGDYSVLEASIAESKDRLERSVIRSPIDGVVNQVYVTTVGEVVKPGETVCEIVPIEDELTVQAYIRPSDIGFVSVGQKAMVKVSAYDYSIYGGLDAIVETIGADAIKDKQDNSFFEVKLKTKKSYLKGKDNKKLTLIPGMTVTVSILTGEKTVLSYILKPFNKARESALQER